MRILFCLLITSSLIAQQKHTMRADFAQDEQFVTWFYQRYHSGKRQRRNLLHTPKYKTRRQLRIETRELGILPDIKEEKK